MDKISQLRVILGDQLSHNISSLNGINKKNDMVVMMEVWSEATYVKHHQQKIAFVFSAMRHFAKELKQKNIQVHYIKLDSRESKSSFTKTLQPLIKKYQPKKILITEPGEYRVLKIIQQWHKKFNCEIDIKTDTRFISTINEFKDWAKGKKELRLEFFYRQMRKKTNLLMQANGKPITGKWNFDQANRNPYDGDTKIPTLFKIKPDKITQEVIQLVQEKFNDHFGSCDQFHWAVTAAQAKRAANHFFKHCLPHFGQYQDAMLANESFLFHAVLSTYINAGLLSPLWLCQQAEKIYRQKKAPINAVEGFIRQILGWREFVRGIYWLHMPTYAKLNFLQAKQPLPSFYWTGNTDLACLQHSIAQTQQHAYSHHIQRLMVTGNFALLLGVSPKEVCDWYLIVYADAYEWVELPNTAGMALFADGGIVSSKPYAASGNYINRQSNFCKNCRYNVKEKIGDNACPFNYLYWDFLSRNKKRLSKNRRLKFAYSNLARIDDHMLTKIKQQAKKFKQHWRKNRENLTKK